MEFLIGVGVAGTLFWLVWVWKAESTKRKQTWWDYYTKRPPYHTTPPPKYYTCDVCGRIGTWDWYDGWMMYNSHAALEAGEKLIRTCSDECRDKLPNS